MDRATAGSGGFTPTYKGFGHVVMEHVAARALNGKSDLDFSPEGVRWSLVVPANHIITDLRAVPIERGVATTVSRN